MSDHRITNSRMQTAKTCMRKHYFAYTLGVRLASDARPLRIGSAFHFGLDAYYKGGVSTQDATRLALEEMNKRPPAVKDEDWYYDQELVLTLLTNYFWRWQNDPIEVLATEQAFELPIINPNTCAKIRTHTLAGKIDKIVRLSDGRIAVMEHKTTSDDISPASDYWRRLRLDQQISVYYLAARELGYDVETVLYDVVRKPGFDRRLLTQAETKALIDTGNYEAPIRKGGDPVWLAKCDVVLDANGVIVAIDGIPADIEPGKKFYQVRETLPMLGARLSMDMTTNYDTYFAREFIPRLNADIDEARYEVYQMSKLLHESEKHNRWPRNTGACRSFFGTCPYFDICASGYSPRSGEPPSDFDGRYQIVADTHPELQNQ